MSRQNMLIFSIASVLLLMMFLELVLMLGLDTVDPTLVSAAFGLLLAIPGLWYLIRMAGSDD